MDVGDLGDYSNRVIQQSVMSKIGLSTGNNLVMQYVVSLIAITLLGVVTNKMTEWTAFITKTLKKLFNFQTDEPTLKVFNSILYIFGDSSIDHMMTILYVSVCGDETLQSLLDRWCDDGM